MKPFERPYFLNHNVHLGVSLPSEHKLSNSVAGNTGNSLIGYSVARQLGQENILGIGNIHSVHWRDISDEKINKIRENHDVLVLLFQTHIRAQQFDYGLSLDFEGLIKFIDRTELPVVIPSLGIGPMDFGLNEFVRHIPAEQKEFFRNLANRTGTLGVRGSITAEVLAKIGVTNSLPIGCPSFFYNGQTVPAGLAGDTRNYPQTLRTVFTSDTLLIKSIQEPAVKGGVDVIVQDEMDLIGPILFGKKLKTHRAVALKDKLIAGRIKTFISPKDWVEHFHKVDLAIGGRLHGAIAAIQGGSRAVIFKDDMRTREIAELLSISRLPALKINSRLRSIYEHAAPFASLSDATAKYEEVFSRYRSFMLESGLDFKTDEEFTHPRNVPSLSDYAEISFTVDPTVGADADWREIFSGTLSRLRRRLLL